MLRTIRVEVTADDIRHGKRESCGSCPLAYAYDRAVQGVTLVGMATVRIYHSPFFPVGQSPVFALPREAVAFIARFDRGEPVTPLSFDHALSEEAPA